MKPRRKQRPLTAACADADDGGDGGAAADGDELFKPASVAGGSKSSIAKTLKLTPKKYRMN